MQQVKLEKALLAIDLGQPVTGFQKHFSFAASRSVHQENGNMYLHCFVSASCLCADCQVLLRYMQRS